MGTLGGWLLLRRHGLWYDELYTSEVAPLPIGRLVRALISGEGTIPYLQDAPPSYNAPYYAVAHGWLAVTRLPADEMGLRLPSLLAAIAAVAVFSVAVARLAGDRRVGAVAGLVTAANPFVVQFAAEARGYSLALLAVAGAALGFARWLESGSRGAVAAYGVASAAAGLLHWFALLVPAGFAVAAVVLRRGRGAGRVVLATALAALPALGLVAVAVANGVRDSGAEWIRGAGGAVPRLVLRSWSGRHSALLAATVLAAAAGLLARARSRRDVRVTALAWFAVPVAAVTAAEAARPVFVDRYLLPATLGLAALVALGVTAPKRRPLAAAAAAVVLGASLAATAADVKVGPKDDVRSAMALVAAQQRPGEPVVAAARWDALGVDHYAGRLRPDLVLPPAPVPDAPALWVVRRAAGGVKGDAARLDDLDRELAGRGLTVARERRFDGRYADVVVQRWERSSLGG